jgi:hypothetical protein
MFICVLASKCRESGHGNAHVNLDEQGALASDVRTAVTELG